MPYKHIIFDIDGTLLDTEEAILLSLEDTLGTFGIKAKRHELTFCLGIPGEVALNRLGIEDTESANKIWNKNLLKYNSSIRLFDGIKQLLPLLIENGYELGIITSKSRPEFANDFTPHQINHYFKTIICVDDSPRPKPHPDPVLSYLEKTNRKPDEVIYIGDTTYDYQSAKAAGVDFGLAQWGNASPEKMQPTFIFKTPMDVLSILKD